MNESHLPVCIGTDLPQAPDAVFRAGLAATVAWEEFFAAHLRNPHTRAAYLHAARRFFAWLGPEVDLLQITPGRMGAYFNQHPGSIATRKLDLAALRGLFDLLVNRHILVINPAHSVRGERYQVIEGKTPEITVEQARTLLHSIALERDVQDEAGNSAPVPCLIGLRDRALLCVLIYTAARAGAVAKLRGKHFRFDGTQWTLRFEEKGGKSREIPVRHDLQEFLLAYLTAAGLTHASGDTPLFRTALRRSNRLTDQGMTGVDICRMMKRRLRQAGLPARLSPHSLRVCTVTDLLSQGVPLESVQMLAGHADPRTTRLYDRRHKQITRNLVERISI